MSQAKDPDSDLALLLGDVFLAEQPDPGLLVRYADDPGSLDPEDLQRIEQYLSESPRHADQLKLLNSFDISTVGEHTEGAPQPVRTPVRSRGRFGALLDSVRASVSRSPALVWAPAAAAAVLLVVLLGPTLFPDEESAPVAVLQPSPGAGAVAQLPAEQRPPQPSNLPQELPDTPAEVTPQDPPAEAQPGVEPVERPTEESAPLREPEALPEKPIAEPAPVLMAERSPEPEKPAPIVLAMATPTYRTPPGVAYRPRLSSGVRGASSQLGMVAVAPEHVGRTSREQPALYWFLPEVPAEEAELEFTVADAESPDPLAQTKLPIPSRAGFQKIDLATLGVNLPLSVEYRWAVALCLDPAHPSHDIVAMGWIERDDAPASVTAQLQRGSPLEIPLIYAEAGFWYDAVSAVSDLIDRYPKNPSFIAARAELLNQGGLDALVTPPGAP